MAAAGVTQANRELVAHEFAATTGEDGRSAGKARTVLLPLTGGEPSDEAALQEYGAADRGAIASVGITEAVAERSIQSQEGTKGCLTRPDEKAVVSSLQDSNWARRDRVPSLGPGQRKCLCAGLPKGFIVSCCWVVGS